MSDDYIAVTEHLGNHIDEADYDKRRRDEHNRAQMVESIMGVRPNQAPPPYDNPLPHGRDKWQAKQGIHRLKLGGRDVSILWALVEYANRETGLCFPSERTIAALLNLKLRAVERGIRSLAEKGLAIPEPTMGVNGTIYNRYRIKWAVLFSAYDAMERAKQERKLAKTDGPPTVKTDGPPTVKSDGYPPSKVTA